MTRDQVGVILEALADKFAHDDNPPIERWDGDYPEAERRSPVRADWAALEAKFGCTFEDSFIHFMELIPHYNLPGTLQVRRDKPSHPLDDERIDQVWDHEMSFAGWDPALIPFNAFGNGDYYCLTAAQDGRSPVWFRDHEDQSASLVADSFADFLARLEWHLNGTE